MNTQTETTENPTSRTTQSLQEHEPLSALQNKLKTLEERFEGIDPDRYRALESEFQKLEETKLIEQGKTDEVIQNRIKALQDAHQKQLAKVEADRQQSIKRLTELEITQAAILAATKRGLRSSATRDLTTRAREEFRIENGMVTAYEP